MLQYRIESNVTKAEISPPIVVNVYWHSLAHNLLTRTSISLLAELAGTKLVAIAEIGKITKLTDLTMVCRNSELVVLGLKQLIH